jgi:hypothetical protein
MTGQQLGQDRLDRTGLRGKHKQRNLNRHGEVSTKGMRLTTAAAITDARSSSDQLALSAQPSVQARGRSGSRTAPGRPSCRGGFVAIASWRATPELREIREDESRAVGQSVGVKASQPLDERLLKGRRLRLQTCVVSRRIQLKTQPKKKAA